MTIGIDISQSIYKGTGVAEYVTKFVRALVTHDTKNNYILFFSNRTAHVEDTGLADLSEKPNVAIKAFSYPVKALEIMWNTMHIVPIEWFIGDVDVFYTSDWLEPPTKKAKKVTTIHDLSVLKVPDTFDAKIVSVHKRKLNWVKKESDAILCDSKSTMQDVVELLGIEESKLHVVYPGIG